MIPKHSDSRGDSAISSGGSGVANVEEEEVKYKGMETEEGDEEVLT